MIPRPKTCWIMSEGIAGTENQCLGLAEAMGLQPVIKRIKLRTPWRELSPWLHWGHGKALSADSDRLEPPYPDLLIASGRKAIGLARHIRAVSGGKTFTVIVQDPRIDPRHFDLVAVPQHDPTRGTNVVVTTAALNRVTPEKLAAEKALFTDRFDSLPPVRVAVLIGGNSRAHRLTTAITQKLCDDLLGLGADGKVGLLVTASRRTGAENAALLRERLQGPQIDFWDGTGPNPYFAFLAAATHIIVTEDSVSMTSEALATGKPVYTVPLKGGGKRLSLFHRLLQEQGFTRPFAGQLEAWSYQPPDDTLKVAHEILTRYEGHASP